MMDIFTSWQFITDLGDSAVTLPLTCFILIYLLTWEHWRQAIGWLAAVLATAGGVMAFKLLRHSCLTVTAAGNVSGHAAMSALAYGGLALLLARGRGRTANLFAALLAGSLIIGIGFSRIALRAHLLVEVVVGVIIGLAALAAFYRIDVKERRHSPSLGILVAALATVALTHGLHIPIEKELAELGSMMRPEGLSCD